EGEQIPYGASVTAGAKYLNTQQDPITGAFFAIKQDASGNVFAEPIVVGNNQNMEFAGSPEQNSLVATYTSSYEGSYDASGKPVNPHGIDLAGKKGSAITSSVAGEVIFVGDAGGWGNQVRIRDASGKVHQFSHLDSIGVQVGQRVNQLDYLGAMGNTGKVLKSDGNPPTPKELAEGRGTHLDYTVYDANGNVMGLETAKAFAGMGQTPFAQSAGAGQQLATTPQWQIEAQQKAQEQSMKAKKK
ncbi:MAG: M23 family metallopeptidase, partial [Candidatus Riesia sp.]|nr:M23 family metallopeptidase [Candidatus Riesia sp.]